MTQPPPKDTNTKLHPPITKSDTRQLQRITRLRNAAKRMLLKPNTDTPSTTNTKNTTQTRTQAGKVLQLPDPPELEDIPALCHKAIAVIINKANRNLADSLRKKEDRLYKNSPKRYHNNLKTVAGLQPNAKDQPKLEAIRDPATNSIASYPPKSSTSYKPTSKKNTPATHRTISHPPRGKTYLTQIPIPTPNPTHPHKNTSLTTTSRRTTTPQHATRHRLAKHLNHTQSQTKS